MLDDPCLDGHAPVISRTAQPQRGAATPTASAGSARSPATQCWSNIATALLHHPDLGDERARLLRRNTAPVANPARANPEIVVTHWIGPVFRSEEHTSELQSLMRISYDVFCLKNKIKTTTYLMILNP